MHKPRLGISCHIRHFRLFCTGRDVLQESEDNAICEVWRKIKVVDFHFLTALLDVVNRDLAGRGINEDIRRLGKNRSFLDVMVTNEVKHAAL